MLNASTATTDTLPTPAADAAAALVQRVTQPQHLGTRTRPIVGGAFSSALVNRLSMANAYGAIAQRLADRFVPGTRTAPGLNLTFAPGRAVRRASEANWPMSNWNTNVVHQTDAPIPESGVGRWSNDTPTFAAPDRDERPATVAEPLFNDLRSAGWGQTQGSLPIATPIARQAVRPAPVAVQHAAPVSTQPAIPTEEASQSAQVSTATNQPTITEVARATEQPDALGVAVPTAPTSNDLTFQATLPSVQPPANAQRAPSLPIVRQSVQPSGPAQPMPLIQRLMSPLQRMGILPIVPPTIGADLLSQRSPVTLRRAALEPQRLAPTGFPPTADQSELHRQTSATARQQAASAEPSAAPTDTQPNIAQPNVVQPGVAQPRFSPPPAAMLTDAVWRTEARADAGPVEAPHTSSQPFAANDWQAPDDAMVASPSTPQESDWQAAHASASQKVPVDVLPLLRRTAAAPGQAQRTSPFALSSLLVQRFGAPTASHAPLVKLRTQGQPVERQSPLPHELPQQLFVARQHAPVFAASSREPAMLPPAAAFSPANHTVVMHSESIAAPQVARSAVLPIFPPPPAETTAVPSVESAVSPASAVRRTAQQTRLPDAWASTQPFAPITQERGQSIVQRSPWPDSTRSTDMQPREGNFSLGATDVAAPGVPFFTQGWPGGAVQRAETAAPLSLSTLAIAAPQQPPWYGAAPTNTPLRRQTAQDASTTASLPTWSTLPLVQPAPVALQRAPAEPPPEPVPPPTDAAASPTAAAASPNIEALAQKVYEHMRRSLLIEHERRGRMLH